MRIHRIALCSFFIFAMVCLRAAGQSNSPFPSDDEIRKILIQRIDEAKQSVGIVVGVIEPGGARRIISYGALAKGDKRPLNGDTVFEIGSISKVFTSLLMSDMVERKELALTDAISKYLPANVKVPERNGRSITLEDLSTHTSGLPRLPDNMKPVDAANPYADYSVQQMYDFLSSYTLKRDVGAEYKYSNFGVGLLGHLLTLRAGVDYETLLRTRVTGPLNMPSTRIALNDDLRGRLAVGHNDKLAPVPNWDLPTLAGAGAIRSTANDFMNFLAAELGYSTTPLGPAMARMLTVRRPTPSEALKIALAWHVFNRGGKDVIWHNGGTGGYRSFAGFDPQARIGVVVLSNTSTTAGVDDIGLHLLNSSFPLLPPNSPLMQAPKEHREITMTPEKLETFVGRYQFTPAQIVTITRQDGHLYVQLTAQPQFEMFPENERDFFLKLVDAQITFEVANEGRPSALLLHQLGRIQRATRFEGEPQQIWFGHKPGKTDPASFDRYVGRYQLTPAATLTITRDDTHLYAQLTGQPKFEIVGESERDYFLTVVDGQLTFEVDAAGKATAVVLHQNGRDQRAPRVE